MREGVNMISILDNNPLDDFIFSTQMHGEDAEVRRVHRNDAYLAQPTTHSSLLIVDNHGGAAWGSGSVGGGGGRVQQYSSAEFHHEQLSIPRKPKWTRDMTGLNLHDT